MHSWLFSYSLVCIHRKEIEEEAAKRQEKDKKRREKAAKKEEQAQKRREEAAKRQEQEPKLREEEEDELLANEMALVQV
jgi:hypothetical protein